MSLVLLIILMGELTATSQYLNDNYCFTKNLFKRNIAINLFHSKLVHQNIQHKVFIMLTKLIETLNQSLNCHLTEAMDNLDQF